MPRPKPEFELKPRQIRLDDVCWLELTRRGGAEWMRKELSGYRETQPIPPKPPKVVAPIKQKIRATPRVPNSIFNYGATL